MNPTQLDSTVGNGEPDPRNVFKKTAAEVAHGAGLVKFLQQAEEKRYATMMAAGRRE